MTLMHYASRPVILDRDRHYTQGEPSAYQKPRGLWVSILGPDDWPTWCLAEEFRIDGLRWPHEVTLADTANILRITSADEIDTFHDTYATPSDYDRRHHRHDNRWWGIGWPRVADEYGATP